MARIQPVKRETADAATVELLDGVTKKMGKVPNLIGTMANSRPVAKAYLGFSTALAGGKLSARLREQISLVVGEANHCDYCVAAHTALGKGAGLSEAETIDARRGEAASAKEQAALEFARKVVQERGLVSDEDVQAVRAAGFDDEEIAELIGNVALNLFTNYFNHVAGTDVDFPAAPELTHA